MTAVLERQRATLEALGCVVEDAEPSFDGADEAFEVLRGVTFAGAFKAILHQVKPTLADNVRFGLSLTPERIARALELRGELFARMREFLEGYDVLAAPVTQVPPFSVERRVPARDRGRRDGLLPGVVSLLLADHRHRRTRRSPVPAGFTDDGLPIGLQLVGRLRGEAALLRLARGVHARPRGCRAQARALMPWPTTPPTAAHRAAFADADPHPFWLRALPTRCRRSRA